MGQRAQALPVKSFKIAGRLHLVRHRRATDGPTKQNLSAMKPFSGFHERMVKPPTIRKRGYWKRPAAKGL